MRTYRILSAVSNALGLAIVALDQGFHNAIAVADRGVTSLNDGAARSAIKSATKVVDKAWRKAADADHLARLAQGRAEELEVDAHYTTDEQRDALIVALKSLPSLPRDVSEYLDVIDSDSRHVVDAVFPQDAA